MLKHYRLYRHPNGYFYHRVKVPSDIRRFHGKQIEQRSLGTRDFREALRRLPAIVVEVDRLFSALRLEHAERLTPDAEDAGETKPVAINIKRVAAAYARAIEAEEFARRAVAFKTAHANLHGYLRTLDDGIAGSHYLNDLAASGNVLAVLDLTHRERVEQRLAIVRRSWRIGDFESYIAAASDHAPELASQDQAVLIKAMIAAEIKVLESWQTDSETPCNPDTVKTMSAVASGHGSVCDTPTPKQADVPFMSEIAEECFADIGREKKWTAKTEAARRAHIALCIEIIGDKPLNTYTQTDMRLLKQTLSALPPNVHARKEFRLLSKVQSAEKAKAMELPGLSVESIRQIMTAASMVYGWASAHYDRTLLNIVHPLMPLLSAGGDKNGKRHSLSIDDLQRLFRQPVFTGVKSDVEWFKPGHVPMQHSGRFWIPLLGIFTGARLMEAVQLVREDVGCEEGIWFVDINENDEDAGKRLKNKSSVRRIPVHQELIRLGFLDFVQSVDQGSRLFSDIKIGPAIRRHMHASKAFNKLLFVAGVKSKRKVWHSLRHSFEQACRDSRVDAAIMDQLQGHAQRGMRAVYGERYKLAVLNEGIQSIRYQGLVLGHIEPFVGKTA